MSEPDEPYTGMLQRLRPTLDAIFTAYGMTEPEARETLEGAGRILLLLRLPVEDAQSWLVRAVVEKCQRLRATREGGGL